LLSYSLTFALLFGGFLAFRLAYFHGLAPNTYQAKGGPTVSDLAALVTMQPAMITKLVNLVGSTCAPLGGAVLLALVVVTVYLAAVGRLLLEHIIILVVLIWAASAYLLLPRYWMGEYRFATPFFPLFYAYAGVVLSELLRAINISRLPKAWVTAGAVALCVAGSAVVFAPRSVRSAARPPVPFAWICERYGLRFNEYAQRLGIAKGSLLVPDMGGTLYRSKLRVYDLGGLCDKTIAQTIGRDTARLHDYILGQVRPTFIHTHKKWAYLADLDSDPRFRRDYAPILESMDAYVQEKYHRTMKSGDYVRRDAVVGKEGILDDLRREFGR
jgi:hypothetical protein